MPRLVDAWPAVIHICDGRLGVVRFHGACRDGQTVVCPGCRVEFAYKKPKPVRGYRPESIPSSQRHF